LIDIKAGCYHAGLSNEARTSVHEKWLRNEVHVVCATIAFGLLIFATDFDKSEFLGMGIDKSNVRFVIHHSLSKSIENFYQETGRAGRDNQQSHCILFFRFGDVFRLASMVFADKSGHGLTNLYSMISYCLNQSQCRRKIIAKYFDEIWQSNDCDRMCDVCQHDQPRRQIERRNCSSESLLIINHLKQANESKQRLTALKLFEQISIKTLTKIDTQRLILQLIIDKYLKEDFHFTPYSTICYIQLGPRAHSNCQIFLDICETTSRGQKRAFDSNK